MIPRTTSERVALFHAIVRTHDHLGGKGPGSANLQDPEKRPRALVYLAAEVIKAERRHIDRARRLESARRQRSVS